MRIVRILALVLLGILVLPYVLTPLYAVVKPVSALMVWRWVSGAPVERQWVDIQQMSPHLKRSVVAAEDALYCRHSGIDWDSLNSAIESARDGERAGGGSTITQQVVKNLFLWPSRSIVRKGLEVPLAMWMDLVLPKSRTLEIYLNIAEWGPKGQFGAESGSRFAFGRGTSSLTSREAATLAAILPNPVTRSAKNPGPGVRRLAGTYMVRARSAELAQCWE